MSVIINSVIKLFFIDLAILAGIFIVLFFCFTAVKAIKNGKKHILTDENIIIYCAKIFPEIIGKHLKNILSWAFIIFIIHVFASLFETFTDYIKSIGTYENNPLIAFFIDAVEAIIPVFKPFVLPALIIIAIIILGYGLLATLHQLYKDEVEKDKIVSIMKSIENKKSEENPSDSFDLDTIEAEITDSPVQKDIPYKPTLKQLFFYFCENAQKALFAITKILPKIIIIIAICVGINSICLSIKNVTTIVENQKKIQELHMTIKNLSKSEGLARITLLNEERTGDTVYPLKTYRIEILNANGDPIPTQTQEFTIRGNEIYIDAININFEYSEISQGEKYNIAYPYRIYSETMIPEKGVPLKCMYENGKAYPIIYSLNMSEIYGIQENIYLSRLAELFETIKDENLSREMGIRSVVGVANHFTMKKNEIRDMFIEGTGGISVKKHESLFEDPSSSIKISLETDKL